MRTYLVYAYQYNTMPEPRIECRRYWEEGDLSAWDCLPPTVIVVSPISCANKKDAMTQFRRIWPTYSSCKEQ